MESIGPGPETKIGEVNVPGVIVPGTGGRHDVAKIIKVPPHSLPAGVAPNSGRYEVGVLITYRNHLGKLTEIAGFNTGATFLIREP